MNLIANIHWNKDKPIQLSLDTGLSRKYNMFFKVITSE